MSFCLFACFLFLFCLLYKIENIKCRKKKKKRGKSLLFVNLFPYFWGVKIEGILNPLTIDVKAKHFYSDRVSHCSWVCTELI